jgi:hypothetical protein
MDGRFLAVRVFCLCLLCLACACSDQAAPHVRVEAQGLHLFVWSYSPVGSATINGLPTDQKGFVYLSLPEGDSTVVLQNGSTISRTDGVVKVNDMPIPVGTGNAVVEKDGRVTLDAHIRTFD